MEMLKAIEALDLIQSLNNRCDGLRLLGGKIFNQFKAATPAEYATACPQMLVIIDGIEKAAKELKALIPAQGESDGR